MADVTLQPVDEEDKHVLAAMLQLYRYDMSPYTGYELTNHGTYVYRFLDHYFLDDDRHAFFVRVDGNLAGFVMTRLLDDGRREMSEFFVVRKHRREGVGRRAVALVFELLPGPWEVFWMDANVEANSFWPDVVRAAADGEITEEHVVSPGAHWPGTRWRFTVTR